MKLQQRYSMVRGTGPSTRRALIGGSIAVVVALSMLGARAAPGEILPATPAPLSFNREIRPILSEHCFNCHGMDEKNRKGRLRLDERAAALKGGKSNGPAIVPGKPDQRALIKRVTAHDAEEIMPPPRVKNPLSAKQIATLKQWIAAGANYSVH